MLPRFVHESMGTHACGGITRIAPASSQHWSSLEELWTALNAAKVEYALLRNFENGDSSLLSKDAHPDIDILLPALEPACCVMTLYGGADKKRKGLDSCTVNPHSQGQHIHVGKQLVKMDIRLVGDGYYDQRWAADMLTRRVQARVPNSSAWAVEPTDHLLSMIYHVLVHKDSVAPDYPPRICALARDLGFSIQDCVSPSSLAAFLEEWMGTRSYIVVRPKDPSVERHFHELSEYAPSHSRRALPLEAPRNRSSLPSVIDSIGSQRRRRTALVISASFNRFLRVSRLLSALNFTAIHIPAEFVDNSKVCQGFNGHRVAFRNAFRMIVAADEPMGIFEDDIVAAPTERKEHDRAKGMQALAPPLAQPPPPRPEPSTWPMRTLCRSPTCRCGQPCGARRGAAPLHLLCVDALRQHRRARSDPAWDRAVAEQHRAGLSA